MTDRIIRNASALNGWRKSSYSSGDGGTCIEILDNHPSGILIRDSKNPHGPSVVINVDAWKAFVRAVSAATSDR
ncbi:DUF397 domain-containing protein [Streptomyces sp. CC77]|uniref:DUF397 domain-containing protein n=1 Tax=Streptomyces sp. CC77 TaxID=1906739 RepID=UPI0009A12244|nr:DUF397 domain-containing protein [Streptomyces sp. CC77]